MPVCRMTHLLMESRGERRWECCPSRLKTPHFSVCHLNMEPENPRSEAITKLKSFLVSQGMTPRDAYNEARRRVSEISGPGAATVDGLYFKEWVQTRLQTEGFSYKVSRGQFKELAEQELPHRLEIWLADQMQREDRHRTPPAKRQRTDTAAGVGPVAVAAATAGGRHGGAGKATVGGYVAGTATLSDDVSTNMDYVDKLTKYIKRFPEYPGFAPISSAEAKSAALQILMQKSSLSSCQACQIIG